MTALPERPEAGTATCWNVLTGIAYNRPVTAQTARFELRELGRGARGIREHNRE